MMLDAFAICQNIVLYVLIFRTEIILCWFVNLFICLLRIIKIIMFGLSCMFAVNRDYFCEN
jgi:hypothetical protein